MSVRRMKLKLKPNICTVAKKPVAKAKLAPPIGSSSEVQHPVPEAQPPDIAAPQIEINADGTLAIDETSLIVRGNPEAKSTDWEVVDEDLETEPKYARKVFKGDEELNTAAMTLSDLVSWNPRNEKKLKWLQDQKESKKEVKSELDSREESMTPAPTPQPDIAAPQIKINADGTLAIDETSLIVRGNPEAKSTDWEVVDEDLVVKKISSTSFRKRVWRKGTPWSDQETDMFYELIQPVGTDFSLMHQFFPSRARSELKSKYNFEKRRNSRRLDMALSNPSIFDESLQTRAETLATQVEEAKLSKKRSKRVKFNDEDEGVIN